MLNELTEEQQMIRDMVRDFAQKDIAPLADKYENEHAFPDVILKKMGDLGLLGMGVPEEFGGCFSDHFSIFLAVEEISRVMPSLAVIFSVHCSLFCYALNHYGTPEQKAKYLPPAARGELLGAFSLTEPGAGSDATNLKTKAVRDRDDYIINGTKAWVTTGSAAGAIIVFARTSEADRKKLSAFIVEESSPGYFVTKIEEKMGLHASQTAEILLDNCRIPASNLLGEEGKGAAIALNCLDGSRIGIAAQSVGLSQRALDEALKYAQNREAFGKPIARLQAIQMKLADIATDLEAGRLLWHRAASLFDAGKPFTKEAAMAKLFASEAANRIVYEALQIHGGYGYSKEFKIEQLYRDARVLSIYEGTSEIQRLVIARELLKQ
ncbi:MAG: acyl-CoA dehydrogenase family protein [Acidobacteriota bacterium]